MAANVFDRNYFEFDLANNEVITDISFDAAASNLLPGSAEPSAQILSSNEIRTVFGEGVIREIGFNPVFSVTTSVLPAPSVTVRNTIQSPTFTGGSEDSFGDAQSAAISSTTTEFPNFVTAYDIDVTNNSIAFRWVDTVLTQRIGGPVAANVFDRNYFLFNLPENVVITDISFDPVASNLLPGSAEPSAQILSSNEIRTVFGEGVIREIGFNPVFRITTSTLPAPSVTVRNTIQSPTFTGGSEDPFGNAQSAIISSAGTEFPGFIDIYDIDATNNSIAFRWIDTEFSRLVGGPVGADVFDRNYFVFNLPENVAITNISFDPAASNLLPGSAQPSAQVLSSNEILTVFGEGVIREIGFNPVFRITTSASVAPPVSTTAAPIPVMSLISLQLMSFGLAGIGIVANRFRKK